MHALARAHTGRSAAGCKLPDKIGEGARRIDKGPGTDFELLLSDNHRGRCDLTRGILRKTGDAGIVQRVSPGLGEGLDQRERIARIVELPVGISDCADQPLRLDGWQAIERFFAGEQTAGEQPRGAGDPIVRFQSNAVIELFEPAKAGNKEHERPGQVRRIAQHGQTFPEGVLHQVVLIGVHTFDGFLEIPDAAMGHFG